MRAVGRVFVTTTDDRFFPIAPCYHDEIETVEMQTWIRMVEAWELDSFRVEK